MQSSGQYHGFEIPIPRLCFFIHRNVFLNDRVPQICGKKRRHICGIHISGEGVTDVYTFELKDQSFNRFVFPMC